LDLVPLGGLRPLVDAKSRRPPCAPWASAAKRAEERCGDHCVGQQSKEVRACAGQAEQQREGL
jgi:hypothetical protein